MNCFKGMEVSENNLLPFLSPTADGTQWYEHSPEGQVTNRDVGRYLLQFHQLASIIASKPNVLNDMRFLDIGTGNGILPQMISQKLGAHLSVGIDPFEDGEHTTSWARNTRDTLLDLLFKRLSKKQLVFNDYMDLLNHEQYSTILPPLPLEDSISDWSFVKAFIEDFDANERFNVFFVKAIDHIHNWNSLFHAAYELASEGAIFIIKHNSFFSFNGAHRYASTFIPWGHVVLNDEEYKEYTDHFHSDRSTRMQSFFFDELSYPRKTMSDLISMLYANGWIVRTIEVAIDKQIDRKFELIGDPNELVQNAKKVYNNISLDEMTSGRYLIVSEKRK